MIEAKLDFHELGLLTEGQAAFYLDRFLMESYAERYKCVLVITGKGLNAKGTGQGRIRKAVAKELSAHKLVKSYRMADPWNGGSGAFEVSLKDC